MYVITENQFNSLKNHLVGYGGDSLIGEIGRQPLKEEAANSTSTQQKKVTIKPKNLGVHHSSACGCRYCE